MPKNPRPSYERSNWDRVIQIMLPVFLAVVVCALAWWGLQRVNTLAFRDDFSRTQSFLTSKELETCLADLKPDADGHLPPEQVKDCEKKAVAVTSLDDLIKSRIDELKWILTLIGSIAAFFVIAQSAAAFFSALLYTNNAEKSLKQIGEIEADIKSRYPVFSAVEEQRNLALIDLAQEVKSGSRAQDPAADPTETLDYGYRKNIYGSLELKKRQRLLSVESFASIDLHPGPLSAEAYPDYLRYFAFFYQSKFEFEKTAGFASFGDLERAELYFQLAIEKSGGDFTLRNDLAVLCMDMLRAIFDRGRHPDAGTLVAHYRTEALEQLNASLHTEKRQMRVHYNLAVLAALYGEKRDSENPVDAKKRHYAEAIQELTLALDPAQTRWQRSVAGDTVKSIVWYNRGCYRAWLLGADTSKPVLTETDAADFLADLNRAAQLGGVREKVIADDFNAASDGDLAPAYSKSDPKLKILLDKVKQDLIASSSRPTLPPQPLGRWKSIQESLKTYRRARGIP